MNDYERRQAATAPCNVNGTTYDLAQHDAPRLTWITSPAIERAMFANYVRRCCDGDMLPEMTTLPTRETATIEDVLYWRAMADAE